MAQSGSTRADTAAAGPGVCATAAGSARSPRLVIWLVVLVQSGAEAGKLSGVPPNSPPLPALRILSSYGLELDYDAAEIRDCVVDLHPLRGLDAILRTEAAILPDLVQAGHQDLNDPQSWEPAGLIANLPVSWSGAWRLWLLRWLLGRKLRFCSLFYWVIGLSGLLDFSAEVEHF